MVASREGVLSVMMPIYNEERTLETILGHVLDRPEVGEVIAVDDGSVDRSWEILTEIAARDPRIRPLRQAQNGGKGAALRRAISEITRPFALVQDSDLEYDPRDYPALLEPLLEGRADVVYGVRGFGGQTAYSFWFVMGNKAVTLASNILFDSYIGDMETGYKVFRGDLIRRVAPTLRECGFGIEPEITAKIARIRGVRICERPIRYAARGYAQGKKIGWRDGLWTVWCILRYALD